VLSLNWLEYFQGMHTANITASIHMFRNTLDVRPKSAFAIGKVEKIKAVCISRGAKIRIVHDPEDNNPAHATIRQLPAEDDALLYQRP